MSFSLSGNILVVGDVMLDVWITGKAERISPEAPVPVVVVKSTTYSLGGAGNVALNLAELGCSVKLYGVRGKDTAGKRIADILRTKKIGDKLIVDPHIVTTTKTRIRAHSQQLLRFDEETSLDRNDLPFEDMTNGPIDAIILSDYAKGVVSDSLARQVIEWGKSKGIPTFVDPRRGNWLRYTGAALVKPNRLELERASGESISTNGDAALAAHKLIDLLGIDSALVTLGARGMILVSQNGKADPIPSQAKEVYDVTGAGDTVIATLVACVCSGYPLAQAAKIANVAAGLVVGKFGTYPITRTELRESLGGLMI